MPAGRFTSSGGLCGIGQLPALDLPTLAGGRLRTWDFRSRNHLVLYVLGSEVSPARVALAQDRLGAIRAENAELVLVMPAIPDRLRIDRMPATRVAIDLDGLARRALVVHNDALLVTNKHGTIYWREETSSEPPDFAEALSWLEYINIIEPECGCSVPAWPTE